MIAIVITSAAAVAVDAAGTSQEPDKRSKQTSASSTTITSIAEPIQYFT